jgi:hypothetical protein
LHGLLDNERLWERLHELRMSGLDYPDRPMVYQRVLERFRERRRTRRKQALLNQLQDAPDEPTKIRLLGELRDLNHKEAQG